MDERNNLIAKVAEKAEKEAKKQKLNEVQAKLFIEDEVKKALEEFDADVEKNKVSDVQETSTKAEKAEKEAGKTSEKEKKYIVHTPVKNYCGEVAGVQFAYGKAEVKPGWILNWFKEHGYKVEEVGE